MTSKRHPKAFFVLIATEFWERFSYFSMSILLVLYATEPAGPNGLGWSKEKAFLITGLYSFAIYLTPFIGGFIADKYLGRKNSAIIGASLISIGHLLLSVPSNLFFFPSLLVLICGSGFYQASMLSIIKELYQTDLVMRANAYNYFNMFINIGSLFAAISAGLVGQHFGYHVAFSMAGFGMLVGLLIFVWGSLKYLKPYGNFQPNSQQEHRFDDNHVGIVYAASSPTFQKAKIRLFYFFSSTYMLACLSFGIVTSGALSLYIKDHIDRNVYGYNIPVPWFHSLDSIGFLIWAPLINWLSNKYYNKKYGQKISFSNRFGCGMFFLALGFSLLFWASLIVSNQKEDLVSPLFIVFYYIISNIGWVLLSQSVLTATGELVPSHRLSVYMGIYNMMMGIGFYLGSWCAILSLKIGEPITFFCMTVCMLIASFVIIFYRRKFDYIVRRKLPSTQKTQKNVSTINSSTSFIS
jgi:POT family proton-dependent oligopeptide transporter